MEYRAAIERLADLKRHALKPGLERTDRLLSALDHPETAYPSIQIAGSNGKGSTAAMTANILREAGLSVGLFTSPHLEKLRERVQVDGRSMPQSAVADYVDAVEPTLDAAGAAGETPTFFEAITAMAFWYFAERAVDIAVVEVGIGGKLDATSVIDPTATAVTSVTLEHTEVLGDTIEEIARDKASIAPDDGPLVTGTTGEARAAIRDAVSEVVLVGDATEDDVTVTYHGIDDSYEASVSIDAGDWSVDTRCPLLGREQARNAGIAAVLARSVTDVDLSTIANGIHGTTWPGRCEIVQRNPVVLLDGAHNPAAAAALSGVLEDLAHDSMHLVMGVLDDKDLAAMADALPQPTSVTTCKPATPRGRSPADIARVFGDRGVEEITRRRSVAAAVESALSTAESDDLVVITGSLYTVGEARRRWSRVMRPRRFVSVPEVRSALDRANVTDPGVWRMGGKGVQRAVQTAVDGRQAQYLKEELLSLGGECAVSGVDDIAGPVDVTMMATMAQYKRLIDKLDSQPYGLGRVGEEIRQTLNIQHEPTVGSWPWADGPVAMGIVNMTPDSFHDGGRYDTTAAAIDRADELIDAGAAIVDIGGESTRPGGDPVSEETERERVVPVVEGLADREALISIDSRKADVAHAALEAGADIINDVSGLSDPAMPSLAADYDVPIVVTHSVNTPVDPSVSIEYDDVVADVIDALDSLVRRCERAGLDRSKVIVDPGIGFGKTPAENFALLDRLGEFRSLACPVLVGHSNKSLFGAIGFEQDERTIPTAAVSALAVERGADILRVHDVAPTQAAIQTAEEFRPFD